MGRYKHKRKQNTKKGKPRKTSPLLSPARFERATFSSGGKRSIHLSYGPENLCIVRVWCVGCQVLCEAYERRESFLTMRIG